jgi:hypothetical protein
MSDHIARAQRLVGGINGDRVSSEMTPSVVAELLEAQVHATLAVAEATNRLADVFQDASGAAYVGVRSV